MSEENLPINACLDCGGKTVLRSKKRYPILLQIVFGASFVVFLIFHERMRAIPTLLWSWSVIQAILGGFLIRARRQAAEKILICIRCDRPVPSEEII